MADAAFEIFNKGVTASLMASQHRANGDYESAQQSERIALEFFSETLELDSGHVGALGGKGLTLSNLRRPQEAIEMFEKVFAIAPENAENLRQLGLCQIQVGDMDKAWKVTLRAIALNETEEYCTQASNEIAGFAEHILQMAQSFHTTAQREQLIAYCQWAASTFALARYIYKFNDHAKSRLEELEVRIEALQNGR